MTHGEIMNIDLADKRELSIYKRDAFCGAPGMNILGLALLPAFGAGAAILAWSLLKTCRQSLIVSHEQIWFQSAAPMAPMVSFDRRDITRVEIRQSWLQSKFHTGDLVIHGKGLSQPIKVHGVLYAKALKQRLSKNHYPHFMQPLRRSPVPVGKACMAPRLKPMGQTYVFS